MMQGFFVMALQPEHEFLNAGAVQSEYVAEQKRYTGKSFFHSSPTSPAGLTVLFEKFLKKQFLSWLKNSRKGRRFLSAYDAWP